jgi:hypothetical protein
MLRAVVAQEVGPSAGFVVKAEVGEGSAAQLLLDAAKDAFLVVPEPVQAALGAANRSGTEAFLDLFTPDGFVDGWGRTFAGRAAIQGWSDAEFIGQQVWPA